MSNVRAHPYYQANGPLLTYAQWREKHNRVHSLMTLCKYNAYTATWHAVHEQRTA